MIVIIVILVVVILLLLAYNVVINKKIEKYKNVSQKITSLNVLQEFMNTIGKEETVEEKINKINNILIEKYDIKYSTIVIFDGAEYSIKATNVNEKHWDTLRNLQNEEIFRDSITTATPKYITVNSESEKLPYQKLEFGRAKSAIFFPLYIENVYIGYWIIESGQPHAFDKTDTTILEIVKDNILTSINSISYQSTLESLSRKDLFSQLDNVEYLYGKGRKLIDIYPTAIVCMFKIINLEDINNKVNRQTGNNVIIEISKFIKESISPEYIFVRYMGTKFLIVFPGVEVEGTANFLEELKKNVENLQIDIYGLNKKSLDGQNEKDKKSSKKITYVKPKLNIVLSTYYKGTALESINKKLEEYLDNANKNESDINSI